MMLHFYHQSFEPPLSHFKILIAYPGQEQSLAEEGHQEGNPGLVEACLGMDDHQLLEAFQGHHEHQEVGMGDHREEGRGGRLGA